MELFGRLAHLLVSHRKKAALVLSGLVMALSVAATGIEVDFVVRDLFPTDDPELEVLDSYEARWGNDDNIVSITLSGADVFAPEATTYVTELHTRLEGLPEITRVDSLASVPDVRGSGDVLHTEPLLQGPLTASPNELTKRAMGNPLLRGALVSASGKLTVWLVTIDPATERVAEIKHAVSAVEAVLEDNPPPEGYEVSMVGVPAVRSDVVDLIIADQMLFVPLGGLFTVLVLIVLYRSWMGLLVPLAAVAASLGCAMGLMVLAGFKIDVLTNMVPILVIIYGVADAIHMLNRVKEERRNGADRKQALVLCVQHVGVACLLTSATTAIGFGSLASSSLPVMGRFGLLAGAGVMVAYAVSLLVVPLGASLLPERPSAGAPRAPFRKQLTMMGVFVERHARTILVSAVCMTALGVLLGARVEVDNRMLDVYSAEHPRRLATQRIEQELNGVVSLNIEASGPPGTLLQPRVLRRLDTLQQKLETRPEVTGTTSFASVLRRTNHVLQGTNEVPQSRELSAQLALLVDDGDAFSDIVTADYSAGRVRMSLRDLGAQAYLSLVDELRTETAAFSEEVDEIRVTAPALLGYRGVDRLVDNMLRSLTLAIGIIAVVLMLFFRSVSVGLISLIPNAVPLAVGIAFMAAAGFKIDPTTVLVFSVALGIAVDDTIHFLARYREEMLNGCSVPEATRKALLSAGQAMVVTSIILVTGFSILVFSGFPSTQNFGVVGMVVLAAALFTDLVVTPACLLVFRPWAHVAEERAADVGVGRPDAKIGG